jgi:hypothetical protein
LTEFIPFLCFFFLWAVAVFATQWNSYRLKRKARESEHWRRYFVEEEIRQQRQ